MKAKNFLLTVVIASMATVIRVNDLNAKTIYYVKANGTGNGTSWANAAGNIQDMIDKAISGDEVWTAGGTYPLTVSLKMKDGVNLYGGFFGNETSISSRAKSDKDGNGKTEAWEFTNETILSGKLSDTENITIVINMGRLSTFKIETLLDGFTVMNGVMGIYADGTATVNNCIIRDNVKTEGSNSGLWGGIIIYKGTVSNSKITNNKAYLEPGNLYGYYSVGGGGITNTNGTVINCTVSNNVCQINDQVGQQSASAYGGGIYNDHGTVINCIITENSCQASSRKSSVANASGGGIYNRAGIVSNCCVTNNDLSGYNTSGGGIYSYESFGLPYVYCSTIVNNPIENVYGTNYCYNCITENSNLEQNFINPNANDYRLKPGSAYIDAGSLSGLPDWVVNGTDLAGKPRTTNGKISVGAYEYDSSYTNINELQASDVVVFPNPATDQITISGLQSGEMLYIYNVSGQQLLFCKAIGETEQFSVSRLPSGIYFVKTSNGQALKWIKK